MENFAKTSTRPEFAKALCICSLPLKLPRMSRFSKDNASTAGCKLSVPSP